MLRWTSSGRARRRAASRPTSQATVAYSTAKRRPRVSVANTSRVCSPSGRPRTIVGRNVASTSHGSATSVLSTAAFQTNSSPEMRAASRAYPTHPTW